MEASLMNFDMPQNRSAMIKVIGIGGGGGNAVNHMYRQGIKDVDFIVCNTDAQALESSPVPVKIQLGAGLTEGRGAGNKPDIGREAAIESLDEIIKVLQENTKMVFITAGMGGGTGTGAAPVIAKAAKELGILTVAIVTIPFRNEGQRRIGQAIEGISAIENNVDSLLIIKNEKIREMYGDLRVSEAFARADNVLSIAAKGIAEIITVHGYINVDFADVETVMRDSGVAIMGSATSAGENRALEAVEEALSSPLLNDNEIKGARNILINITSGEDEATMDEIGQVTDYIQACAGDDADVIWGNGMDENLGDALSVTVVATGFNTQSIPELYVRKKHKDTVELNEVQNTTRHTLDEGESVFEVKTREPERNGRHDNVVTQRTFEFSVDKKDNQDEAVQFTQSSIDKSVELKKAAERVENIKRNYQQIRELGITEVQKKFDIEELENQPAYMRKKVDLKHKKHSEEEPVSRFSLEDDGENGIKISDNNRYLFDNVD